MTVILVRLTPPVAQGAATFHEVDAGGFLTPMRESAAGDDLTDRIGALVDAGYAHFVVDIDGFAELDENEVKALTSLVWSVRSVGGEPVVLSSGAGVTDTVRHFKLDRAFTIVADLETALIHLRGVSP